MKISFTTKVQSNVKKFSNVAELPPDLREIYERALANGPGKSTSNGPRISTRLVVNGREIEPTDKMSELEQKLCTDVLQLLKDAGTEAADHSAQALAQPAAPLASASASSETGWLTKKQQRLVLVVTLLAAVALALWLVAGFIRS